MLHPIQSLLPALKSRLTGCLVNATAWSRLESLAATQPAVWCWGCFEVRLKFGDDRVDFAVCAARGDEGQEALAQVLAPRRELPIGEPVRRVLEEWCRPGSLLYEKVPAVWVEYDLPEGRPR